jgi:hypothetical protein
MKSIKTIMLGAVVAISLAGVAQATTKSFYIAGSTAFRAQTNTAIMHLLGSTDYVGSTGVGTIASGTLATEGYAYGYGYTGSGSNLGGASNALFVGTIAGVGDVIIHTTWTGSESGLYTVCIDSGTGANVNFIADTATLSLSGANNQTAATPHTPDAAMSDTFQTSSQWSGGATVTYADSSTHVCSTLTEATDSPVAVTYFAFGVSKSGKDDGITNITSEQARYVLKAGVGSVPVTYFVPSYSGTTAKVYVAGRDPDSGTRLSVFGEIGVGLLGSTSQYYAYDSSNAILQGAGTISYIKPVPAATVNNVPVVLGNSGYSSGGNLVKAINSEAGDQSSVNPFRINTTGGAFAPIGSCLMTYAGISDLNNLTNGLKLTYNGVAATDANVQNGNYPLWTYEHMYLHAGSDATVANKIATQLRNVDFAGTGAISRASMKVQRLAGTKDGGSLIQPGTL